MTTRKRVNLALQGGGSHGAFTWGVLDTLLADGRLEIEAVSGTSAGAMNAAIMLCGWTRNGAEGAREALRGYWTELGRMSITSPFQRTIIDRLQGNWNLDDSPAALWADVLQRTLSPSLRNPLGLDPLRALLRHHFDENAVRDGDGIKAFIAATNVRTGKVRIFTRRELTIDALLASAALPNVHEAVVIDGMPYWDGGFRGNPPIWPFIYGCDSRDVVMVELDPVTREGVPQSSAEIADRLNEITFGGALMAELRAIAFIQGLIEQGAVTGEFGARLKMMHIHSISDEPSIKPLGAVSKFLIEPAFLEFLFGLGRAAAMRWLETSFEAVGQHSSIDIRARYL